MSADEIQHFMAREEKKETQEVRHMLEGTPSYREANSRVHWTREFLSDLRDGSPRAMIEVGNIGRDSGGRGENVSPGVKWDRSWRGRRWNVGAQEGFYHGMSLSTPIGKGPR